MSGACAKFEELLIDLLYDELEPEQRNEVMAHCQDCAKCQVSLDELQLTRSMAGLSQEDSPPDTMDEAILGVARTQAAVWAADEKQKESKPRRLILARGFTQFIDNLRVLALHPATVSASVVVVITVLAVFIQQQDSMPSEPYPEFKAEPAIPFELTKSRPDADLQEEAKDEAKLKEAITTLERMNAKGKGGPSPAPEPASVGASPTDTPTAGVPNEAVSASPKRLSKPKQRKATLPKRSADTRGRQSGDLDSVLGYGGQSGPQKRAKVTPGQDNYSSGAKTRQRSSVGQAGQKKAPMVSSAPAPSAPAAADDYRADRELAEESAPLELMDAVKVSTPFDEGLAAYRRGNCTQATGSMQQVATGNFSGSQKAEALYILGDCAKRKGNCSVALTRFDQLLSRHPGSSKQGPALWSAAMCHKKLGQTAHAKAKLQRLMDLPAWKKKAEQAFDTL